MKILIVDDEPHIIRALTLLLGRQGYDVLAARNGIEGLETLRAEQPDIAIVDVMMPQLNGLELLQTWYSQVQGDNPIQFIMLTASCDEGIKATTRKFANVQLVPKPFSPRTILIV